MKILPYIILFASLAPVMAQPALERAPCWLKDAASVDQEVWLLCESDQLLSSRDAGETWRLGPVPVEGKMRALAFVDERRGFALGESGTVVVTEDGGATWKPVETGVEDDLNDIQFVGEQGWIAGYDGVILHTADGGRTWARQTSGVSQSIEKIFILDEQHGWAVGWSGMILRTSNGGESWELIEVPEAQWSLSGVYFRDAQNGWVVGMLGQLLRSRDGGATWEVQQSPVRAWLTSVAFDQYGHGWITTENDLLVSEDGGESWRVLGRSEWMFLNSFVRVKNVLWAIGPFGALKRTGPGVDDWKRIESLNSPSS